MTPIDAVSPALPGVHIDAEGSARAEREWIVVVWVVRVENQAPGAWRTVDVGSADSALFHQHEHLSCAP